jgi:RNA polymerase sigma factor (sigma-70 family)
MKKDDRTDELLYAAARTGDQAAGAQLYARYFGPIRGFFVNKVAEPGLWDDLAQQTFVKVLYELDNMHGSSFRAYLFGVAYNVLRSDYRRRHTQSNRRGNVEVEDLPVAELGPGVSTLVANKAEAQRLIQALRQIPIKYQSVFEMYFWQDMTAEAIATLRQQPVGTIRGHIRLAKKALASKLELQSGSFGDLIKAFRSVTAWAREVRAQLGQPPADTGDDE